jgi:glutamine cyclotransferase
MKKTLKSKSKSQQAEIVREYGPYPGINDVAGVTFDGTHVWFAGGASIVALNPKSGAVVREIAVPAEAGTAFDGEYLWQIADARIQKVDPRSGEVVATIPAPAHGRDSGLTWAEGTLCVGEYRARKIHQIDAKTGAILRTIESDRFVTGVSWVNGELWHGTLEAEQSELRHVDPETGEVLERLDMPAGVTVSGLEGDGAGVFYCGGAGSGKVRAVRKPKR